MTEFPLPFAGSGPEVIVYGPDGAYWFANFGGNSIGRISADGSITNYFLANLTEPYGMVVGPDNNLWFTEAKAGKIGRMSPTNGSLIAEYFIRTNNTALTPGGMAVGPDNRIWFTEFFTATIGAITLGTGTNVTIQEYTNITAMSYPYHVVTGPDGNMWFTENVAGKIGRMTTNGVLLAEYPLASGSYPQDIIVGTDGALWFTEYGGNKIGRISTNAAYTNYTGLAYSTNGLIEYPLPVAGDSPYALTLGNDGKIWFTEYGGGHITRLTFNGTNAVFDQLVIPSSSSVAPGPTYLVSGPDGSIWFTEYLGNNIGRILFPALQISAITNSQVLLYWPTNDVGFQLQSNTNLTTTNWFNVTNIPVVVGTNYVVTNQTSGNNFYRLIQ